MIYKKREQTIERHLCSAGVFVALSLTFCLGCCVYASCFWCVADCLSKTSKWKKKTTTEEYNNHNKEWVDGLSTFTYFTEIWRSMYTFRTIIRVGDENLWKYGQKILPCALSALEKNKKNKTIIWMSSAPGAGRFCSPFTPCIVHWDDMGFLSVHSSVRLR